MEPQEGQESNGKSCEYQLLSVLMHRGDADSGHYWALVRDSEHARWLEFNDMSVSTVALEEVLSLGAGEGADSSNASLLVYVRCSERPGFMRSCAQARGRG